MLREEKTDPTCRWLRSSPKSDERNKAVLADRRPLYKRCTPRFSLLTLPLIVILLITFPAGCVPRSEQPLSDPEKAHSDPSILGTWTWHADQEDGYLHIGWDDKSGLLRFVMVDLDGNGGLDVSELIGHTSSLEGNTYLNLKWVHPESDVPGYILAKYAVRDDSLGISLMSPEPVEKAIAGGLIMGKVGDGESSSSLCITEEQKGLQEFIIGNDRDLFPETTYMQRLRPPKNSSTRTSDPADSHAQDIQCDGTKAK